MCKFQNLLKYLNYPVQLIKQEYMKRPQDNDIFNTKSIGYAPRISNQQKINPNAGFQARMDAQYEAYTKKIGSSHRGAFDQKLQQTKVNQHVNFDENYHHLRKDADLQSSIFYQPSMPNSRVIQRPKITERVVPKHAYNMQTKQIQNNFGKKQILDRQVRTMPQNTTNFKGNSSNIFGYDQHIDRNGVKNKINKLIPHQMQWTQHDSIRNQDYIGISRSQSAKQLGQQIIQSKSQVFNHDQLPIKQQIKIISQSSKQNISSKANMIKKKVPTNPQQKYKQKIIIKKSKTLQKKQDKQVKQVVPKPSVKQATENKVQISILKGWSSNIMEELSKYCRLNGTKILSVNFQQGGKGNLILEKSKRWETVTDWLRRDAKLKIRVMN